jgi:hypothetical protein
MGRMSLCDPLPVRLVEPAAPKCSAIEVELRASKVADVADWLSVDTGASTSAVRVTGRWDGSLLVAEATLPPKAPPSHAIPCAEIERGHNLPPTEQDVEALLEALGRFVEGRKETYSGYWVTELRPGDDKSRVAIVGTIGALAISQVEIGQVYPFARCVHPVEYSGQDLEAVQARLQMWHPDWSSSVSVVLDRVVVRVPFVDADVAAILNEQPEIVADPLVRSLGQTAP